MLIVPNPTGENLVAVFISNATGKAWGGAAMVDAVADAAGVALAAIAGTTLATLTKPVGLPDDVYAVMIYARQGALAIATDPVRYTETARPTTAITPQAIRDAMKLAPSAGDAAKGSIDQQVAPSGWWFAFG